MSEAKTSWSAFLGSHRAAERKDPRSPGNASILFRSLALPAMLTWQTALGSAMYAFSQERPHLGLLAILISLAGFVLTDWQGWIRLHWAIANAAALVAVGYTLTTFQRFDPERQLLAIADLLLYLQFVLLFQAKTIRLCWQLTVLSFLQVLLGAALTFSLTYGLMLIPYFLGELWLLVLLAEERHGIAQREWSAAQRRLRTAGAAEIASPGLLEQTRLNAAEPRWRAGNARLLTGTFVVTLAVAAAIFFVVPRIRSQAWALGNRAAVTEVGFSSEITLGQLGDVLESEELVMRTEFLTAENQPYRVSGEPLFRGAVLNHYSRGQWKYQGWSDEGRSFLDIIPRSAVTVVRQRTTVEPLDQSALFHIYPVFLPTSQRLERGIFPARYDDKNRQVYREPELVRKRIQYEVLTTGLSNGRQQPITPETNDLNIKEWQQLQQLPSREEIGRITYRAWNPPQDLPTTDSRDNLTALAQIADEQLALANLNANSPGDRYLVSRALEKYLKSSRFQYSLRQRPRAANLDPIVDFVRDNPQGHCEYFASALALMLRLKNIPARVVVGFKGGDYNYLGAYYQVRQMHAHAWVEAYLERDQIAEFLPVGVKYTGGWLTLDPTPDQESSEFAEEGFLAGMADIGDYLQVIWSNYVVGLNAERQQDSVYRPLQEWGFVVVEWLTGYEDGQPNPELPSWGTLVLRWLMAGCGLLLAIAIPVWLWRRWLRTWRVRRAAGNPRQVAEKAAANAGGEWWNRLVAICSVVGWSPERGQTPLEFAHQLRPRLLAEEPLRAAAAIPQRIVERYYRARFGRASLDGAALDSAALDSAQAQAVEQELCELSQALGAWRAAVAANSAPPR